MFHHSWIWRHHLTTSPRFSSISAMPTKGRAGSTVVSAVVPSLRECPVHQIPRNGMMPMFQRGHVWSWKICLVAALQVVFKNVTVTISNCYFSPSNVDILNILTFAKPNAVSGCHVRVDFGMDVLMILMVTVAKPFQQNSQSIPVDGGFHKWRYQ